MNYRQTLDFLFSRLPMFQRSGAAAYKNDLERTIAVDNYFGQPHRNFRNIHIAGTNGKGSVAAMLASVLQESGYRTGLFTSPHYRDFRERIRVNGEMIPEAEVISFTRNHFPRLQHLEPSFFELTFGLAEWYFSKSKVDVVVWETGLGGRLDSTNVVSPVVSVITNIGFDHMQFLGDTREKIATEKGGIIKETVPVVIGEKNPETTPVFEQLAGEKQAQLFYAQDEIQIERYQYSNNGFRFSVNGENHASKEFYLPLLGEYQMNNIKTVFKVLDILQGQFEKVNTNSIHVGLKNLIPNTGFLGRFQLLSDKPLTIADSGHNEQAIRMSVQEISRMGKKRIHFVLGMVNDKDIASVLKLLPPDAVYYFAKAGIPRGLPAEELKAKAGEAGLQGQVYASVPEAYKQARANAASDELVFVGGSIFTVAEVV